jgi:hypothetical protein
LIFGIASLFLGFESIEITGVINEPSQTFYHYFYFGVISYPSRIDDSRYGILYNSIVYYLFVIIIIVGYILNFGYFKTKKASRLRKNLNLISVTLMSVGLFGSVSSPVLTLLIFEIPPTTITFWFDLTLLPGFYMVIAVIILVLMEFIILEKTRFFRNRLL